MLLSLLLEKSVMVVSQVPRDGLHPSDPVEQVESEWLMQRKEVESYRPEV